MIHFGFLNAFWLKLLMAALMLADHLYYQLFPAELYAWHLAARAVAPVFAFFVSEGMIHTHDPKRYLKRILLFAGLMFAGNTLLFALFGRWIENSILVELGIAGLVILCAGRMENGGNRLIWGAGIAGLFAASILFEGMFIVPAITLIFYAFRRNLFLACVVFGVFCVLTARLAPEQIYMLLAVVPILCYNGERGPDGAFARYFFYVFYPVHLWAIFLIEELTKR